MKKMAMALVLALALFMGANALAEGPVLMVELPENAVMVENFEFEDGDFVQTYQIPGGVTVQILRYAAFDMTLEELTEGEWAGYTAAEKLDMDQIDGYPAKGMHLTYEQEGEGGKQEMSIYTVMLEVQEQKLIFQAVFPKSLGDAQIEADMHLTYEQEGEGGKQEMSVYTMMLEVQEQKLIFQAVFPKSLGDAQIEADMHMWMDSMTVSGAEDREVG